MGVDVDAMFEYGYKVRYEEIPDADNRFYDEFSDCADEPDGFAVSICGKDIWCADLVTGDNSYVDNEDQDWYIGVVIPSDLTPEDLATYCHENDQTVKDMYELVMRKPPTDEPRIHVYARWW